MVTSVDEGKALLTLGLYSSDRAIKFFNSGIQMIVDELIKNVEDNPQTHKKIVARTLGCYAKKNTGIYESEFYNAGVDINTIRKKVNKYLHSLKMEGKIKGYRLLLRREIEDSFWDSHQRLNKVLDYDEQIRCCHYVDSPDRDFTDVMTIGDYFTHSVYITCRFEVGI